MNSHTMLKDIQDGEAFILNRSGNKYKRIGKHSSFRVLVKPIGHKTGVMKDFPTTLNIFCAVTKCG
ncbi:MAG: hypothetical protein ACRCVX_02200 [Shewanella sp.]